MVAVGGGRWLLTSVEPTSADSGARASLTAIGASQPAAAAARRAYKSRPDLKPPVITITGSGSKVAPGYVFLTPANGVSPDGPMIIDNTGDLVWLRPDAASLSATDLGVSTYRGEPVLTWWEGEGLVGYGQGSFVIADTSYREIARVRAGNGLFGDLHEFVLTPQGSALFICFNTVAGEVPTMRGLANGYVTEGVIQEVDVATGRVLFEWHSADHVSELESFLPMAKGPTEPYDYFHANSIDVAADGSLLLSARHTWAVYKIDRGSGAILWRLGGSRSDFRLGPGVRFAWQHDARWQPDGTMTIFDDGADGPPPQFEAASRGILLDLDMQTMNATLLREWVHPAGVLSSSQGSFRILPNGDGFLGWGNVARFSEFNQGGQILFDGTFETKGSSRAGSYRAFRFPWSARPAEPPRLVVDRQATTPIVYASWNGATDVTTWAVLSGTSSDALEVVTTADRTGFETAIQLPARASYVAVQAVGGDGRVLGNSAVVQVSSV